MKNLYIPFIAILLCTHLSVQAQGTLQFNQALLVSSVQTVPSGKLWKVENILPSSALSTGVLATSTTTTNSKIVLVNGTPVYLQSSTVTDHRGNGSAGAASSSADHILSGPIWLPASTTLASSTGVFAISVLEFNIIP